MEPKQTPNTGNRGKGRPKGSPNRINKALKEMILGALDKAGGEAYLVQQAQTNPNAFMTLVGKVLPMTVAGDPENPLGVVTRIELVAMSEQRKD
jgi:hypothetical protein